MGKDTVVFPGFDGGAEWGGPAVDPETGILYVNSNEMAWTGALAENTGDDPRPRHVYLSQCAPAIATTLAGSPPEFPSLNGIGKPDEPEGDCRRSFARAQGECRPSPVYSDDQLSAFVDYVMSGKSKEMRVPRQRRRP